MQETLKFNVRSIIWNENIDFTCYIHDTNDIKLLENRTIIYILISNSYANDFRYISNLERENLNLQTNCSRVVLIRPSNFLHDSKEKMHSNLYVYYNRIFSYQESDVSKIKYLSLFDNTNPQNCFEVYSDTNYTIRDIKDSTSKKQLYRQLINNNFPNDVDTEINFRNVPEQDSKNSSVIPIKTAKNFKSQKLHSCADFSTIISHFIKLTTASLHFLNFKDAETTPLEILVLGASVGLIPFLLKKIYKDLINVTAVECNSKLKDIGLEFFGINDPDISWIFESTTKYIDDHISQVKYFEKLSNEEISKIKNKKKYKKYDLILINEKNYYSGQNISPNPHFFNEKVLKNIRVSHFYKRIF